MWGNKEKLKVTWSRKSNLNQTCSNYISLFFSKVQKYKNWKQTYKKEIRCHLNIKKTPGLTLSLHLSFNLMIQVQAPFPSFSNQRCRYLCWNLAGRRGFGIRDLWCKRNEREGPLIHQRWVKQNPQNEERCEDWDQSKWNSCDWIWGRVRNREGPEGGNWPDFLPPVFKMMKKKFCPPTLASPCMPFARRTEAAANSASIRSTT